MCVMKIKSVVEFDSEKKLPRVSMISWTNVLVWFWSVINVIVSVAFSDGSLNGSHT